MHLISLGPDIWEGLPGITNVSISYTVEESPSRNEQVIFGLKHKSDVNLHHDNTDPFCFTN